MRSVDYHNADNGSSLREANANRSNLAKCAGFLSFRGEQVWKKRRRRFALPAQSKKGFVECGGKRSATPLFLWRTNLGINFSVSGGI
jgi:hypothetical protein